jgi:poly(3-hydroxybutyrate) depolymerase
MLYQLYETQRSLMEPFSDLALAAAKVYGNPTTMMGQSPFAQRMSASYDLMHRLGKDYVKPEFGLRTIDVDGVEVAIHERIELDKPFCELRRFKRFSDDSATLQTIKDQPAVVIVAPLSGHYATLLRDTVKTMLKDHKVYITDWKNARLVPMSEGEFHLDDYVNYVQEFIRHVQKRYGNCHVMSVCQPTVPVLAAVSLMAARGEKTPLSMTMMGGPIDARKSPTAVNNLAMNKPHSWFENNVIYRVPQSFPGAGRRVYPGFLQHSGFVAMNPSNHATSHYDYFKDLIKGDDASTEAHRKFYDEYNAVLDMDADYYLETIKVVFQDFSLVNGTWDVKGVNGRVERVRPEAIKTTALLSVEGELDDISGSGQTQAVHDICSGVPKSAQVHFEAKGAGHYGIFSGRRWRDHVYPVVKAFILSHHNKTTVMPAAKTAPTPVAKVAPLAKAAPAVQPVMEAPIAVVAPVQAPTPAQTVAPVAPVAQAAPVVAVPMPAAEAKVPVTTAATVKVEAPVNVTASTSETQPADKKMTTPVPKAAATPIQPAKAATKKVAAKRIVKKQ